MELFLLDGRYAVCKLKHLGALPSDGVFFLARTDLELSLVCAEADVPADCIARENGWRALRVCGTLDFSLVGVLAELSGILAGAGIPIFCVSTYDTDYLLFKDGHLSTAKNALTDAGHCFCNR